MLFAVVIVILSICLFVCVCIVFLFVVGLQNEADRLVAMSVADSTADVYGRHEKEFLHFSEKFSLAIDSAATMELWVASLSRKGLGHGTILSRVSAIKHMFKKRGLTAVFDTDRFHLLLQGVKRLASGQKKVAKAPATISHLRRLGRAAGILGHGVDGACRFRAMVTLAFFGFLRPSEYCRSAAGHSLRVGDVRFLKRRSAMTITLHSYKHSKAPSVVSIDDVSVEGVRPVARMHDYYKVRAAAGKDAPLFDILAKDFRYLLDEVASSASIKTRLSPHCFRHGGATWASKAGWSDARIRAHGRWRSNAYLSYISYG